MTTLYKIYVMVLAERLRGELKEGGIIPQNQGFKKGMEPIDNTYVLNYITSE